MDVKNIERDEKQIKFQVVVDAPTFDAAVNKVYQLNRQRFSVPGFRKGKAPRKIIEGMYGADIFHTEAVNALALEAFRAGMEQQKDVRTVGDPAMLDFHVEEDKSLLISFQAALYPEVTLGEYKGLTAYKPAVTVSDEEVDRELERIRERDARIVAVDRPAEKGDTVVIDYDGYLNGKRFSGGKAENHSLVLGSGAFVPGFEDQLVGATAGEEKSLDITFPEDYGNDLAGRAVVFKVKVHEVQEKQLPELDDDFAMDVSEYDSLAEYKESIRQEIAAAKEERATDRFKETLLEQAAGNITVEIPDEMIAAQINYRLENMARSCEEQGMTLQQYLQMMGFDMTTYRRVLRPIVTQQIRVNLMLEKVAEAEQLEATAEEIEQEYETSAKEYNVSIEDWKKEVSEKAIASNVKVRKAEALIVESGIPSETPPEEETADAAEEKTDSELSETPAEPTVIPNADMGDAEESPKTDTADTEPETPPETEE